MPALGTKHKVVLSKVDRDFFAKKIKARDAKVADAKKALDKQKKFLKSMKALPLSDFGKGMKSSSPKAMRDRQLKRAADKIKDMEKKIKDLKEASLIGGKRRRRRRSKSRRRRRGGAVRKSTAKTTGGKRRRRRRSRSRRRKR